MSQQDDDSIPKIDIGRYDLKEWSLIILLAEMSIVFFIVFVAIGLTGLFFNIF